MTLSGKHGGVKALIFAALSIIGVAGLSMVRYANGVNDGYNMTMDALDDGLVKVVKAKEQMDELDEQTTDDEPSET